MDELVEEHRLARETVKRLVDARDHYLKGQGFNLEIIKKTMTELVNLYPEHIRKEDKEFFFPSWNISQNLNRRTFFGDSGTSTGR